MLANLACVVLAAAFPINFKLLTFALSKTCASEPFTCNFVFDVVESGAVGGVKLDVYWASEVTRRSDINMSPVRSLP